MPDDVRIRIGTTADNAGTESAKAKLEELTKSAQDLISLLKLGVGIDLGSKIVEGISALPGAFRDAVAAGVNFNATVESAQLGIAAILRQTQPEKFSSVTAAFGTASGAIDQLKIKATETTASFSSLAKAFSANAGIMAAAGIPLAKQVDLTVSLSNAVSGLGLAQEQLQQETRALLTGDIDMNAVVARTIGITHEDIAAQRERGTLYDFLTKKLAAFAEAGKLANETFAGAKANLGDVIEQVLGEAATPVVDELKKAFQDLQKELRNPAVIDALREIGIEVASVVHGGAALGKWALENAGTLQTLANAAVLAGVAFSTIKIAELSVGLGLLAARFLGVVPAAAAATAATVANATATTAAGVAAVGAGARVASLGATLGLAGAAAAAGVIGLEMYFAKLESGRQKLDETGQAFVTFRERLRNAVVAAPDTNSAERVYLEMIGKALDEARAKVTALEKVKANLRISGLELNDQQKQELALNEQLVFGYSQRLNAADRTVQSYRAQKQALAELLPLSREQLDRMKELERSFAERDFAGLTGLTQARVVTAELNEKLVDAKKNLAAMGVPEDVLKKLKTAADFVTLSTTETGQLKRVTEEYAGTLFEVNDRLTKITHENESSAKAEADSLKSAKERLQTLDQQLGKKKQEAQVVADQLKKLESGNGQPGRGTVLPQGDPDLDKLKDDFRKFSEDNTRTILTDAELQMNAIAKAAGKGGADVEAAKRAELQKQRDIQIDQERIQRERLETEKDILDQLKQQTALKDKKAKEDADAKRPKLDPEQQANADAAQSRIDSINKRATGSPEEAELIDQLKALQRPRKGADAIDTAADIRAVGDAPSGGAGGGSPQGATAAADAAKALAEKIGSSLGDVAKALEDAKGKFADKGAAIEGAAKDLPGAVESNLQPVLDKLAGLPAEFATKIQPAMLAVDGLPQAFQDALGPFGDALRDATKEIPGKASETASKIADLGSAFTDAFSNLASTVTAQIAAVKASTAAALAGLQSQASGMQGQIDTMSEDAG